jgi:hypothetical protein
MSKSQFRFARIVNITETPESEILRRPGFPRANDPDLQSTSDCGVSFIPAQ